MKYRPRLYTPTEAVTFEELVQIGRNQGVPLIKDMPWSFKFQDRPVTHENDRCYLVLTFEGRTLRVTPSDMLIVTAEGGMVVEPKASFLIRFEPVYVVHAPAVGTVGTAPT